MSHRHHGIPDSFKDFYTEVKLGNVAGHRIMHKFGRNDSILNNIWDLISPTGPSGSFPASGVPVRITAGGDAADVSNGAGAREITIVGINTDLQEVEETIATSGAGVSLYTTNSFWRVYRSFVSSVGTYNGNNVGDINIANGETMATIVAGEGQTQHGALSIPTGKTGYLLNIHIMVDAGKAADFRLFTRENFNDTTAPMSPKRIRRYFDGVLGHMLTQPNSPMIILPALTDIWFEARGGGAGTEVSISFDILLVDDDSGHIL